MWNVFLKSSYHFHGDSYVGAECEELNKYQFLNIVINQCQLWEIPYGSNPDIETSSHSTFIKPLKYVHGGGIIFSGVSIHFLTFHFLRQNSLWTCNAPGDKAVSGMSASWGKSSLLTLRAVGHCCPLWGLLFISSWEAYTLHAFKANLPPFLQNTRTPPDTCQPKDKSQSERQ